MLSTLTVIHNIRSAYKALVEAVPALINYVSPGDRGRFTALCPAAACRQEDFANVRFWHQDDWKDHQKLKKGVSGANIGDRSKSTSQDVNKVMLYAENAQGEPVSNARAAEICQVALQMFHQLANHKLAPPSWKKAGADIASQFYTEMESQCEEMRLCSNHWKSDYLATQIYPSWHVTHISRAAIKNKVKSKDESMNAGSKRESSSKIQNAKKKTKTDEVSQ